MFASGAFVLGSQSRDWHGVRTSLTEGEAGLAGRVDARARRGRGMWESLLDRVRQQGRGGGSAPRVRAPDAGADDVLVAARHERVQACYEACFVVATCENLRAVFCGGGVTGAIKSCVTECQNGCTSNCQAPPFTCADGRSSVPDRD